jgi:hypothetical protein
MANIKFTYTAATILSLTAVANNVSASNSFVNLVYSAAPATKISFETELLPTRRLTETATVSDSTIEISVTKVPGDTVSVSESHVAAVSLAKTDSVTVTDTPNKIINSTVDFDLSDSDIDPDPITVSDAPAITFTHGGFTDSASSSDSPSLQPNKFPTDSVSGSDSLTPFTIGKNPSDSVSISESPVMSVSPVFTDSASVTESISTVHTAGDMNYLYPSRAFIFDTDTNPTNIRGYHRGLDEAASNFEFNGFKAPAVPDITGTVGNEDALVNGTVILEDTADTLNPIEERIGIWNTALINQPILNSDIITYGGSVNAGLLVKFIYTDTTDSPTTGSHALNGHFVNETPMGAGSY